MNTDAGRTVDRSVLGTDFDGSCKLTGFVGSAFICVSSAANKQASEISWLLRTALNGPLMNTDERRYWTPSTERVLGTDFDGSCKLTDFVGSAFICVHRRPISRRLRSPGFCALH
jgi:hypothetical protein